MSRESWEWALAFVEGGLMAHILFLMIGMVWRAIRGRGV